MIASGVSGAPRSAPLQKSVTIASSPLCYISRPRVRPIGPPDQTEDSKT